MFARVHLQRLGGAVEPFRRGRAQDPVAIADPADALSSRLHHRRRRARRLHRRLLRLCRHRARDGRQRRRHPDRRGAQAPQRPRHRRPVLGGSRQVRLRLGRPSHGVPDGGPRLRRHRALARPQRDTAQRRYRRRHHQVRPDRERPRARHLRHRGRRPPDRRGRRALPDPHRASGRSGRAFARRRARVRQSACAFRPTPPRGAHGTSDHGAHRSAPPWGACTAPAGDRRLAPCPRQQGHRRHDLLRRRRGISLQAGERGASAISAPISPRSCATPWRTGATFLRSGTRARASARP